MVLHVCLELLNLIKWNISCRDESKQKLTVKKFTVIAIRPYVFICNYYQAVEGKKWY